MEENKKPVLIILGSNISALTLAKIARKEGFPVKIVTGDHFLCPEFLEKNAFPFKSGSHEIRIPDKEISAFIEGQVEEFKILTYLDSIPSGVILKNNHLTGISVSTKEGIRFIEGDTVIDTESFLMSAPILKEETLLIHVSCPVFSSDLKTPLYFNLEAFPVENLKEVSIVRGKEVNTSILKVTYERKVPYLESFSSEYQKEESLKILEEIFDTFRESNEMPYMLPLFDDISITLSGHKNPSIDYPSDYYIFKSVDIEPTIDSIFKLQEDLKEPVSILLSSLECNEEKEDHKGNVLLTGDIYVDLIDDWKENEIISFPKRTFVKRTNTDVFISGKGKIADTLKRELSNMSISYISDSDDTILVGTESDENNVIHAVLTDKSGIFTVRASLFIDASLESTLSLFTGEKERENLSDISKMQEESYGKIYLPSCEYDFSYDDIIEPKLRKDLILSRKENGRNILLPLEALILKSKDNVLSVKSLFAPGLFVSSVYENETQEYFQMSDSLKEDLGLTISIIASEMIHKKKSLKNLYLPSLQKLCKEKNLLSESPENEVNTISITTALNSVASGDETYLPLLFIHTDEIRDSAIFMARLSPENKSLEKLYKWCESHPSSSSDPEDQMLSFF